MPNFGSNFCMERSVINEKKKLIWYNRNDQHCWHEKKNKYVCCWCGTKEEISDVEHGKFLSFKKKDESNLKS